MFKPLWLVVILLSTGICETAIQCGDSCSSDSQCATNLGNPCTFCNRGKCSPLCGVGCRDSSDCVIGGNPCTMCSSRRVCVNPVPQCGAFCGGYSDACKFDSTGQCAGVNQECCTCHPTDLKLGCGSWNTTSPSIPCGAHCNNNTDCAHSEGCFYCNSGKCSSSSNICGAVCSNSGQCTGNSTCSQCVGYYCSKPASCGQVCISNSQCQGNPSCKACISTLCTNYVACGGACGSDTWCNPKGSCPVCNRQAKCASSWSHRMWFESASPEEIQYWKDNMKAVSDRANLEGLAQMENATKLLNNHNE